MPAGSTKEELTLFAHHCQKTGLDPFSRQIYPMKRWDNSKKREVISFQISIDGFRVIAERNGQYAGQIGPHWCGPDGVWTDVWLKAEPPAAARVGILRKDFKEPIFAVAIYDEYVQKTKEGTVNTMWKKMAANQIAKCAESLALRRTFPNDLSGFYTTEEMAQAAPVAEKEAPIEGEVVEPEKRSSKKLLQDLTKNIGQPIDAEEKKAQEEVFTAKPTKTPEKVEPTAEEKIRNEIKKMIDTGAISLQAPTKLQFVTVMGLYGVAKADMPAKAKAYMTQHFSKNKWDELTLEEQQETMSDAVDGLLNEPCLL